MLVSFFPTVLDRVGHSRILSHDPMYRGFVLHHPIHSLCTNLYTSAIPLPIFPHYVHICLPTCLILPPSVCPPYCVFISHYIIYITICFSIICMPFPPWHLADSCSHIPTPFTSPLSFTRLVLTLPLSLQPSGIFMIAFPLSVSHSQYGPIDIHVICHL